MKFSSHGNYVEADLQRYVVLEEVGDEEEEVLHCELVEGSFHDGRHVLQHEENVSNHIELFLRLHLRAEELHQDQCIPHRASGRILGGSGRRTLRWFQSRASPRSGGSGSARWSPCTACEALSGPTAWCRMVTLLCWQRETNIDSMWSFLTSSSVSSCACIS